MFFILLLLNLYGQVYAIERSAEKIIDEYNTIWGFDFITAEQMIVNEKNGVMSILDLKTKKKTILKNVPKVNDEGQGGLMDVKVHYDFAKNKWIYFTYSYFEGDKGHTRLARAKLEGKQLNNLEVLFTAKPFSQGGYHYGSRIAFDKKGFVYIGVGERNERKLSQDLNTHHGKVIRLHEDGKVPKDNPFVGEKSKKPEIWSYGHRNPQGIVYDTEKAELWLSEHGPRGGDEINLVQKGKNYGWPLVSYGREYWGPKISDVATKEGVEAPLYQFTPSIAPSSLVLYKGDKYPEWTGSLFQSALKLQHINRLDISNRKAPKEEKLFHNKYGRIRHLAESPDGRIYFSTDSGEMYLIK